MALAWKAGWVNALAGSNPASSAVDAALACQKNAGRQPCKGTSPFVVFRVPGLSSRLIRPSRSDDSHGSNAAGGPKGPGVRALRPCRTPPGRKHDPMDSPDLDVTFLGSVVVGVDGSPHA